MREQVDENAVSGREAIQGERADLDCLISRLS
jgi:hypothetical protein